jgi:hypothetical protein
LLLDLFDFTIPFKAVSGLCVSHAASLTYRLYTWFTPTKYVCGNAATVDSRDRYGGGARQTFSGRELALYRIQSIDVTEVAGRIYAYEYQCRNPEVKSILERHPKCISCDIPVHLIVERMTKSDIIQMARLHQVWCPTRLLADECRTLLIDHHCTFCDEFVSIFVYVCDATIDECNTAKQRKKQIVVKSAARIAFERHIIKSTVARLRMKRKYESGRLTHSSFLPRPLNDRETRTVIRRYCDTMSPANFVEDGCAICGCLRPLKELTPLAEYAGDLTILEKEGVTRKERFTIEDPIEELSGPVIAEGCSNICIECQLSLDKGVVPKLALANHNWVGEVPEQLKNLSYAECMLIARVRHNRTVVRVNSGRVRMNANAIMFSQPALKVYLKLPPCKEELNEVLAFVFTGSSPPTPEDFDRTPIV